MRRNNIDISPSSRNVQTSRASGIQFTFKGPVNALGFEVGDWGTCCQPSALYLSFDKGAPIEVGESLVTGDAYLTSGGPGVFVGAIDDTNKFTTVEFWGDGAGEFLVAGGKIRYANVAIGSVSNPTAVPEPFTIVGTLIGATAAYRTRKRLKATNKL
ncbi:PEP-CTERM sorting domain-containing protein [Chamaesiphon sp.]|uniref:PEP-CTERM sorting domain-containing protein n=1 Tax=Chamaesiphon sp. TaxID=2814140 RepID=UPI003593AF51